MEAVVVLLDNICKSCERCGRRRNGARENGMISYDLAKKLEEAGFPQGGNGRWIGPPSALVLRSRDRVYVPTLEELIETCGSDFLYLNNNVHEWKAIGVQQEFGRGATPTEAIARLWLALYANTGTIT
jgi:hypothetical protein